MTEYPVSTDEALAQAVSSINAAEAGAKIKLILGADVNLTQSIQPENAIDLEVCSAEGGHYTITARNFSGAQSVFEIEESNLTLRDITVKLDAATYAGWCIIYEENCGGSVGKGNIELIDCVLDGGEKDLDYIILVRAENIETQLNMRNSTIRNMKKGNNGVCADGVTMNMYAGSSITDCSGMSEGAGLYLGEGFDGGTVLNMYEGSSITNCSVTGDRLDLGNGGGLYIGYRGTVNMYGAA